MPQEDLGRAGWAGDPVPQRRPWGYRVAPWVLLLALTVALWLALQNSRVEVTVVIDGQARRLRTRAGTVAELIAERSLGAEPGDLVRPAPAARLSPGSRVEIHHPRRVRILVDGTAIERRSHARSPLGVLQEAGITLGQSDRIKLNGRFWRADRPAASTPAWLPDLGPAAAPGGQRADGKNVARPLLVASLGPLAAGQDRARADATPHGRSPMPGDTPVWLLEVHRAMPVTVVESNLRQELLLAGGSIGEALRAAGVPIQPGDVIHPPADLPLVPGMRIDIARATSFRVTEAGISRPLRAWASTVGEALEAAGLALEGADYSIPAPDTPLESGMSIEVVRVVEDILVQEVPVAYGTITEPDDNLELDRRVVLRPGERGLKEQRVRIRHENGREVTRQVEEERIVRPPVAERVAYGTRVVWQTVDTPEGPKRFWRKLRVYATSYSASRAGTPRSAPWYGRTRMGLPARRGIVAVDRRIIPLGTWLYVPGYGVALAGDTGGGIRLYHIDLCFDDDAYESWHQYVDVYLLEPLPPPEDMPWILP